MPKKSFGSAYFGEWITDEYDLPAYNYTCNHIKDPKAISATNEIWRMKNEHSHQVGNDRLVGVASNYGYIQVRQDEGSPKYLNDYDPDHYQYGGGFGYLIEENEVDNVITTYFTGNQKKFERFFGIGYFRKKVENQDLLVDQTIFAPFGDDSILISKIKITNNRSKPVNLRWIEYWASRSYQFSYKSFMKGLVSKKKVPEIRRNLSDRFDRNFSTINDEINGILIDRTFKGYSIGQKIVWGLLNIAMATIVRSLSGGAVIRPVKNATLEDKNPPKTFLVSLDKPADGFFINASKFFGDGGPKKPSGITEKFNFDIDKDLDGDTGLFLQRKFSLEPKETKIIYFAFGYITEDKELNELLEKYQNEYRDVFENSCEKWRENRIKLNIKGLDWVDRELQWHYYYLRSNLTYDSFFNEHILSQGHVYQYLVGFQGASRDPCQHVLPFIYSHPNIVKEIIRYTFKTMKPNGEIPYGIVGHGMIQPAPFRPSDLELWLIWLTSEYVLAWKDLNFLSENIQTYPVYGKKSKTLTISESLERCYNHFIEETGTGKHGLQKLSNGDWNDMVVLGYVPRKKQKKVKKYAESVLNSAMATYTLDLYAKLLQYSGNIDLSNNIDEKVNNLKVAISVQWTGKWFKRAWLSEDYGWVGEDILWLEPQPWAIIGDCIDSDQIKILVDNIDKKLRGPSKIGATLMSEPLEHVSEDKGMATNAGVWFSINGTLIWALAKVDPDLGSGLGFDEWIKNSLANHAEYFPDIWYGIWSGPDTYNSHFSKYPGQTLFFEKKEDGEKNKSALPIDINWTDFPVMNMHPHAWPLYTVAKLLGIEFTQEGLELTPAIPKDEYEFSAPLLGFKKTKDTYSGYYSPKKAGEWKVNIKLSDDEIDNIEYVEINGKKEQFEKIGDQIKFYGQSKIDNPLEWKIKTILK